MRRVEATVERDVRRGGRNVIAAARDGTRFGAWTGERDEDFKFRVILMACASSIARHDRETTTVFWGDLEYTSLSPDEMKPGASPPRPPGRFVASATTTGNRISQTNGGTKMAMSKDNVKRVATWLANRTDIATQEIMRMEDFPPRVVAEFAEFDAELAKRIQAVVDANQELRRYCRSRVREK